MTSSTHLPAQRRWRREQGSAAIELVLLTPILIAVVFAVVQTALVWNARHTVGAAAQHGARVARTATALQPTQPTGGWETSDEQLRSAILAYLRQTGGKGLQDSTVTVRHDADALGQWVTVTVAGTTVGVLPGTTVRVSGSSRTPLEGFRP